MTAQMRKAAVSIPANLAEGAARGSSADFARFVHISMGSLAELETYVDLSERLEYVESSAFVRGRIGGFRKLIAGLRRSLAERR